ncbi:hypothetical protein ABBQ32_009390 [Trebouxia sp. C0010 RCD-2024]
MPPFRRSSTQAADWRWGAQATPDTPAAYLPSFVLHPMPPGAYMLGGASQPGPRSAVQATCSVQAGYALPSPPPFPRHGFANQRRPHPEQPARPVAHPPVRDRVSNTRIEFNPDAKPFVGSLRGVASAAAPAIVKEAMDTGNTGNSRSLSTCGQELHGSPSTLSSAAGPYVPATLSSSETQGRASTQQSHSATFEAQVEAQLGVDKEDAMHRPLASLPGNEDSRMTQQGAAHTDPAPQPTPAGHFRRPLPPLCGHAVVNHRLPQPEQHPGPVIHPSIRGRISNARVAFNAGAKPFVGSLRGVASSAAPANFKEARDMGSGRSFPKSGQELNRSLNQLDSGARPYVPATLCNYETQERAAAQQSHIGSGRSSSQGGQELKGSPSQLSAATMPYVPAGLAGYEAQEHAPAQQSPIATSPPQNDNAPIPDRQHDRQLQHVQSMLLPEETTDGNIRSSTTAPDLIQATGRKELAQLGVDNQGAVHIASYSLTADSSLSSAIADEIPTLGGESESVSREKLCTAVAAPECDGSSGIPERCPRPVIQPSVQHRVSNTRMVFNADAKPFVGSLRGVASSAAPANVKGAKVTGSAGSRHSFSRSGQELRWTPSQLDSGARPYVPATLCSETQEQAAAQQSRIGSGSSSSQNGQELHRLAHELNAAAVPYVPAGFSGYGAQEQAAAQQSPVATIPAQSDDVTIPDRQHDRQLQHVLRMLLPEETTGGNTRPSTTAPHLIQATGRKQPAQLADEPVQTPTKRQNVYSLTA